MIRFDQNTCRREKDSRITRIYLINIHHTVDAGYLALKLTHICPQKENQNPSSPHQHKTPNHSALLASQ